MVPAPRGRAYLPVLFQRPEGSLNCSLAEVCFSSQFGDAGKGLSGLLVGVVGKGQENEPCPKRGTAVVEHVGHHCDAQGFTGNGWSVGVIT